ncbi:MAG: DHH family phosphoesterase [Candidatus Saccharimonadales bacterium]
MTEPTKFEALIEQSERILATSHISPDPDAVCSVLLLGTTLKVNFPGKKVHMVLEENPSKDLAFLTGYDDVQFGPITDELKKFSPNLVIIVDAMNFERISRLDSTAIRDYIETKDVKLAIIDHHQQIDIEPAADAYINKTNPATAQELYELLFEELGLKKPNGYAETTLLGIISDTARHKYDNPKHRQTFKIVSDLIDAGASIEKLENRIDNLTHGQLEVLDSLIKNISSDARGFTYSYVDDTFTDAWLSAGRPINEFKSGFEEFTNRYLKNFEGNKWGFAVYRDISSGEPKTHGASFRSVSNAKDVSKIANQLGGGGHKAAAGARITADNIEAALKTVLSLLK